MGIIQESGWSSKAGKYWQLCQLHSNNMDTGNIRRHQEASWNSAGLGHVTIVATLPMSQPSHNLVSNPENAVPGISEIITGSQGLKIESPDFTFLHHLHLTHIISYIVNYLYQNLPKSPNFPLKSLNSPRNHSETSRIKFRASSGQEPLKVASKTE